MQSRVLAAACAALLALSGASASGASASGASAKTFRFANDGDVGSLDPYARNEAFHLGFVGNIYEPLVRRDRQLRIEPALATAWAQTAPDRWRFTLRRGVKFQDGSPFTADDVVFSFERVRMDNSNLKSVTASIKSVAKIDAGTVELVTDGPNPILPEEISRWFMMSKLWAQENDAVAPADPGDPEEAYTARHANGTGPFALAEREPGGETTLTANSGWWDKPEHDLDHVVFRPIGDADERVAALLAGEIDMLYAVPAADVERLRQAPGIKLYEGPELRTIFLGFDQWRDELQESNVKGRNPFKDVRVRRAFYQAIDEAAIKRDVMHGAAEPTGLMIAPGINGYDKTLDVRLPYDPARSKALLAAAGYPHGFEVAMDCPNDRYVDDAAICSAIVAMLAKVGVTIDLATDTRSKYFAKILSPGYKTSFYMLGWAPATYDARNLLFNVVASRTPEGQGLFNLGGYSNPRIDELTRMIQSEPDPAARQAEIDEAMTIHRDEVGHIPLHQQTMVWAARDTVELAQPADDSFPLRFVKIK
jgi:peptide/nickel transport system substrate-binding protein